MLGVHYYPHTDMYERGAGSHRCAAGAARRASCAGHPRRAPADAHAAPRAPTSGRAKDINELCWELEDKPGVVDCTFFHGFPFTDTPDSRRPHRGDDQRRLARWPNRSRKTVARYVWEQREDVPPRDRYAGTGRAAVRGGDGEPVVINETSDNSGGGAPGDSTHLLRAMLDAKVTNACFGFIFDPEVAAAAHRAGVGATIDVHLGGKHDDVHGEPSRSRATSSA